MVCAAPSLPPVPKSSNSCQAALRGAVSPPIQQRLQRIEHAVQSARTMLALQQDAQLAAAEGLQSINRFRYCSALREAIAPAKATHQSSSQLIDTVKLGLKLRLFDPVHQLATSMDSEDHSAVVPVLQALVEVVRKGDFQDWSAGLGGLIPAKDALVGASLASLIKSSDGRIATKESLLGHLKYYLRYLHAVSPTEGNVFSEISRLLHELEGHIGGDGVNDDHSEALEEAPDHEVVTEVGCVLCKFQVSGHIHAGVPTQVALLPPSRPVVDKYFFGKAGNPHSPAYRTLESLWTDMEDEYDAACSGGALKTCRPAIGPSKFSMGNLFDVIGSAHYIKSSTSTAAATRVSMNNLVEVANNILEDSSCLIRMEQLLELHKCILDASSGQAGVLRPGTAVGYVEPGIYRVFLPAGEVSTALQSYLGVLNARDRWQQRPLLCAYYAFAALVFFIHPFHDGNGRCARILGSVVAMKLGFRPILRASDKTLTLGQFLQKHAML